METRQTRNSVASSPKSKGSRKHNPNSKSTTITNKPVGLQKKRRPPRCKTKELPRRSNVKRPNGLDSIITNGTSSYGNSTSESATSSADESDCDRDSDSLCEDASETSEISVVGSDSSLRFRLRGGTTNLRNLNDKKSSQNGMSNKNNFHHPVLHTSPGVTSLRKNHNHDTKSNQIVGRGRKRLLTADRGLESPKRQRSSAVAANLKITQSPTHNRNVRSNASDNFSARQLNSCDDFANQTVRSHNSQVTLRQKRSRSISSSCSRRSPLLNGGDYESESEEQTLRLRCPVEGCDSSGHLSGEHESHFTQTTCPIFHNLSPKECEERYQARSKGRRIDINYVKTAIDSSRPSTPCMVDLRKISSTSPSDISRCFSRVSSSPKANRLVKSPPSKPGIKSEKPDCDNQSLLNRLIECRKREINQIILHNSTPQKRQESLRNPSREPKLRDLTPIFDYEIFREAQAKAAEQLQGKAKDVKMRYGIKCIDLGRYEIDVWYGSPYPEEYRYLPKLFICEFCLKYMTSAAVSRRHVQKCLLRHPPGNEIYRKGNISFFEVDGQQNEIYCQNLCLLAKLFLDHKTLYFDVAPFLFYVMTEYDEDGFHIIGYFSKEKNSFLNYNVSCILTLPPYQKQGYGKLLIDLSYLITRLEGKVGSPEKPLSDMGLISYRSYWKLIILEYLCNYKSKEISIKDISQETGVNAYDIISTLQAMGMLKYWKGKHLILTRQDILDDYRVNKRKKDSFKRIDPSCLKWKPPCIGKS